jgi:hypothetical protein
VHWCLLLALLAACGDNRTGPVDAGPDADPGAIGCVAFDSSSEPELILATKAAADMNGDGFLDLVGRPGQFASDQVSVRLSNGVGGFRAPTNYALPTYYDNVFLGDVAGDSRPDLLIPTYDNASRLYVLALFVNQGDGSFANPTMVNLGYGDVRYFVGIADLDGDGDNDLVVLQTLVQGHRAVVYRNLGSATFAVWDTYDDPDPSHSWYSAVSLDVDGDGRRDVVLAGPAEATVLRQKANGTFTAVSSALPTEATEVRVGDLDGDGTTELVVHARDGVAVMHGTTAAALQTVTTIGAGVTTPDRTGGISVADGDGDGDLDLLVRRLDASGATVLVHFENQGGLAFASAQTPVASNDFVAYGQTNTDSERDVITSSENALTEVLPGTTSGVFKVSRSRFHTAEWPVAIASGDINGDGIDDLVTANDAPSGVSILMGNGDATFQPPQQRQTVGRAGAVTIADLHNDGRNDIIVAGSVDPFGILSFDWLATYAEDGSTVRALRAAGGGTPSLLVVDLDDDGDLDIVVGTGPRHEPHFEPDEPASLSWFRNEGGTLTGISIAVAPDLAPVTATDLDGDGDLDLIAGPQVLMNDGAGTFVHVAYAPFSGIGADLDGDGRIDLVHETDSSFEVALGDGNGTFHIAAVNSLAGGPITVSDVNDDGHPDVVYVKEGLVVHPGRGDGSFANPLELAAGGRGTAHVLVKDFDRDGRADIAFVREESNAVYMAVGTCPR